MSVEDELRALWTEIDADPAFGHLRGAANFVPGVGSVRPRVVLVGEAPGATEDRQRRPFVGRAGKVLDKLLASAGLTRDQVWITNLVKYRPPENRDPTPGEAERAKPYLRRELDLLWKGRSPKFIAPLGRHAARLWTDEPISVAAGYWIERGPWNVLPLRHPAVACYNPTELESMMTEFRFLLDRPI